MRNVKEIASLEEGTCTDRAVGVFVNEVGQRFFETDPAIIHKPTFAEMIEYTRTHPGAITFIPHLRTDLNAALTYVAHWRDLPEMVFPLKNPPLYLADGGEKTTGKRCAALPILRNLIRESLELVFIDAHSTQDAARKVQAGEADLCVTNEHGVEAHGLRIREQLKEMCIFWMPWVYDEGY